jgi:hypothetical protein
VQVQVPVQALVLVLALVPVRMVRMLQQIQQYLKQDKDLKFVAIN